MPTLITSFNWGSSLENENRELTRQLSTAYTDTAIIVNTKIARYVTNVNPPNAVTASQINKNLDIGDVWVDTAANSAWMMTSRTTDLLVTWTIIT